MFLDETIEGPPSARPEARKRVAEQPATAFAERLEAVPYLTYAELRAEWRRLYRAPPPKKIGRDVLELGIAWKLQEKALGGTSAATKRRLADLAQTMEEKGDLMKSRAPKLKPGAKLMREWRGETHDVLVMENGFLWKGERWRSLSLIAHEITGTRWSGPRFFGLAGNRERAKAVMAVGHVRTDEELVNA
jgi:hypothetical protein